MQPSDSVSCQLPLAGIGPPASPSDQPRSQAPGDHPSAMEPVPAMQDFPRRLLPLKLASVPTPTGDHWIASVPTLMLFQSLQTLSHHSASGIERAAFSPVVSPNIFPCHSPIFPYKTLCPAMFCRTVGSGQWLGVRERESGAPTEQAEDPQGACRLEMMCETVDLLLSVGEDCGGEWGEERWLRCCRRFQEKLGWLERLLGSFLVVR